jgi:hypothetical protein
MEKAGLTFRWEEQSKGICRSFFHAVRSQDDTRKALARKALKDRIEEELLRISKSEQRYGIVPPP